AVAWATAGSSIGLLSRWQDVKYAFAVVNQLVGDIPKVTPSSKMVGDFAVFLVQNDLLAPGADLATATAATRTRVLDASPRLDFPLSVVQYFQGQLGNPPGGYPEPLRAAVLKGLPTVEGLPGDSLPPLDLDALGADLTKRFRRDVSIQDVLSAALYPRVLADHFAFRNRFGDVSILDTPTYFYGMDPGDEIWVDLEEGKTLVIRFDAVSEPSEDGTRTVYFTLNGQGRQIPTPDRSIATEDHGNRKADAADPTQIGAPMPGKVIALAVRAGDRVTAGDPLVTLEAMKMETVVRAPSDGVVTELVARDGRTVQAGDLLAVLEAAPA
ncbi:MAG: biotin/lipoyl-containing protein, partial [Planctomycetota bacterium]